MKCPKCVFITKMKLRNISPTDFAETLENFPLSQQLGTAHSLSVNIQCLKSLRFVQDCQLALAFDFVIWSLDYWT